MAHKICLIRSRGTATSAIWKITEQLWRTTLAPIFTNRWRSVVSDHCLTDSGLAHLAQQLPAAALTIGVAT
jgi:hypothetical protein